jgi:hypothetical protein
MSFEMDETKNELKRTYANVVKTPSPNKHRDTKKTPPEYVDVDEVMESRTRAGKPDRPSKVKNNKEFQEKKSAALEKRVAALEQEIVSIKEK